MVFLGWPPTLCAMLVSSRAPPATLGHAWPVRGPTRVRMAAADDMDAAADMDLLFSRIEDVKANMTDCRLYVMSPMVPGQKLTVTAPPPLVELFTSQGRARPIVVLGRDRANVHTHGVEVKLRSLTPREVVPGIHPEGTADLVLEAGRVCEVRTLSEGHRWLGRPARGRWISLDEDGALEDDEVLARSEALGAQAEEWVGLVRSTGREKYEGQLAGALQDLGPIPAADRPNARALWVAGLINPVPALPRPVANEVRPEALAAPDVRRRLRAVEAALSDSLRRLRSALDA